MINDMTQEEIEKEVPKVGTWLCNVNKVSLQMEVYWKEATENEPAGYYMKALRMGEVKWDGHDLEMRAQLKAAN